jgi:hypothetical protein
VHEVVVAQDRLVATREAAEPALRHRVLGRAPILRRVTDLEVKRRRWKLGHVVQHLLDACARDAAGVQVPEAVESPGSIVVRWTS